MTVQLPFFEEEPEIRVLIMETADGVTVSGSGLEIDGQAGTSEVSIDLEGAALTSADDRCTGTRCVFTAPDGVSLGDEGPFPGRLELLVADGEMFAVLVLPLETYLRGVVSAEIPGSWDVEVQKAQAIAARSYALTHIGGGTSQGPFDVTSTTLDQVYRARENPAAAHAVGVTRGQVLISDDALVEAFYHSTCGGRTEDPTDVWPDAPDFAWATTCSTCTDSSRYRWQARVTHDAIAATHPDVGAVDELVLESRASSGRVLRISLRAGEASVSMPATEFRRAIGTATLPSTFFEVEESGDSLTFRGRGFGHGVGMCQWGAHGLVRQGRDYREVLQYYYRGSTLRRVYD